MTMAIINVIFNITGRAADNANLLWELRMDENIEATLIKIKKGKIILDTFTNSVNLSLSLIKPGAKIVIKNGIKISITKTNIEDVMKKINKMLPANFFDSCLKLSFISLV